MKVLAVKREITAPIFLNLQNFETERDRSEKHEIKSLDLQEISQFDLCFIVVSSFVAKLREFKKIGTVNTFLTASTLRLLVMTSIPGFL